MKIINQLRHGMNNNISDVTLLCRLKLWAVITISFIRTTLIPSKLHFYLQHRVLFSQAALIKLTVRFSSVLKCKENVFSKNVNIMWSPIIRTTLIALKSSKRDKIPADVFML
jgi:hypothetical protein